ncbi:DNA polymerase interacting tpr containing protein of 47kD isoform X2 [Rhynchophorus ferrugineus]|uniref:DNA polymerase interacting tpr containing protein of 47kD isoform X2 n=1 Tax=Rhynchophorus ferrugineus TaxID=354439 RepID=UPI003FCDF17D
MDGENSLRSNKTMTDVERLELAQKLDADLDEFINNLPRRKYEDGWPEDSWEEEMFKHPFFMKKSPQPGEDLHPLYEGLQKLKYDPEENEPHELAIAYKEDGNFNFKHKNYRLAIVAYTEGIKQKCGDVEIEASLLNNRSAAHWFLNNYRSCLRDCVLALKIKPDYDKVISRAANCAYYLKQYEKAIQFCDKLLDKNKDDKIILELRKNSISQAKLAERNERKNKLETKRKKQLEDKLIKEILERGYIIEGGSSGNIHLSLLEPCFPQLANCRVSLDTDSNLLIWPVVFVYPEYKIMDYIQQFPEDVCFYEQLKIVFETFPEWDKNHEYTVEALNVYFETEGQKIIKIDLQKTLSEILHSSRILHCYLYMTNMQNMYALP